MAGLSSLISRYPAGLEQMRRREYPMLQGTTYLDHAGTAIHAKSLVEQVAKDMNSHLFGNPHSHSPSSTLTTNRVEQARSRVLKFFKADPEKFDVIFVANATAAIKLVADAFRDNRISDNPDDKSHGFYYYYHRDCHTSLVGVREVSAGSHCFKAHEAVEAWIDGAPITLTDDHSQRKTGDLTLFAYPAQSNMNGHRLPLAWPGRLRRSKHLEHRNCYTLLDAAAYVATAQLDLSDSENAPDFVALSFYKIFGYPDLGALLLRKESGKILQKRKYFGGGTVDMVVVGDSQWYARKGGDFHDQFEDGTLPFHNIMALNAAIDVHEKLYGSMDRVSQHTCRLAKELYCALQSLRHANGLAVCTIYKEKGSEFGDSKLQGPTVTFNLQDGSGKWVAKTNFEKLAIENGIQLRTGGLCNPGGVAAHLELNGDDLKNLFVIGVRCGNSVDVVGGKPTGVIRASLGAMSTMDDVNTLINFVKANFVEQGDNGFEISEKVATDPPKKQHRGCLPPMFDLATWRAGLAKYFQSGQSKVPSY